MATDTSDQKTPIDSADLDDFPDPPSPFGRGSAECDGCFSLVLNQFAESFDKSAKRWELIVYPSLFAFIVLAMYGFFLIYSLTKDISRMATSIDPQMGVNMQSLNQSIGNLSGNIETMSTHLEYISDNMETMSVDMQAMSHNINGMTTSVDRMTASVESMSGTMVTMDQKLNALDPMVTNMAAMNQAIRVMSTTMGNMGYDMRSASRPMSFMNNFMPWGN